MTSNNSLIQRLRQFGNPVIQGERATIFWEGESAPQLIGDLTGWDEHPKSFRWLTSGLKPSRRAIWSCSLTVPRDAYVEYAFHDPITQEHMVDPWNRRTVSNGFGNRNNFFYMPETMPSPFSMRRADVRTGLLTRHRVDAGWLQDDGMRNVYLYKPHAKGPFPLLVVYDGPDFLQRGLLTTIVDNLIADGRIRPIALAFLQNGKSRRNVEYFCSDATLLWLEREILPLARRHIRLIDIRENPGAYGVLGASAGGLMSMYTGFRMPDIFGKVICQSAVYSLYGRDFAVKGLVHYQHARDLKIWMDIGRFDELLEDNRRMVTLLHEKGYDVTYREFSGGHNYTAWRDDLWRGLETMFPVP